MRLAHWLLLKHLMLQLQNLLKRYLVLIAHRVDY